jgi:xanthine dehydrogenase YagT iron-sulfur-binding subunit
VAKQEDDGFKPMSSLEKLSRRAFLSRAGAMGVATITAPVAAAGTAELAQQPASSEPGPIPGTVPVTLEGERRKTSCTDRFPLRELPAKMVSLFGEEKEGQL